MEALVLVGQLHPALVHLPIGLLFGAALLEIVVARGASDGARWAIGLLLSLAALGAVVSVSAGLLLALEGGYNTLTIGRHRALGIAVALAAVAAAVLHYGLTRRLERKWLRRFYRFALAVSLVLVLPAGHLGRILAHGTGYLDGEFAHWLGKEDRVEPDLRSVGLYETEVQPLLESRCYSCHGSQKQKGDLRLDREAHARQGGASGNPAIVPGEATRSEIVRRVLLAEDHEDAMPQKGERLTAEEVMRLVDWINAGALFHDVPAPDPAAIAALESRAAIVRPIASHSNEVRVDLSLASGRVAREELLALAALAPQLVWLSLAGRDVSGPDFALLGRLVNLRQLHLERSDVTDGDLAHLSRLARLEYLNLHETQIGDTGLVHLTGLAALEQLFLWRTRVNLERVEALAAARPGLEVVLGWNDDGGFEVVEARAPSAGESAGDGTAPRALR